MKITADLKPVKEPGINEANRVYKKWGVSAMNDNSVLGVSISRNDIRFVEAELWQDAPSITNVVEIQLDIPLDAKAVQNPELIPHFATLIDNAVDNSSLNARDARLSIYQDFALIKTFPVEAPLKNTEIRQHIEWELEQALISPRDHFNVGFELYPQANGSHVVVVAALRKSIVNYLQDIFKKSLVTLKSIDIDLTAELRALNSVSRPDLDGTNILVHYDGLYFNLALIKNSHFLSCLKSEIPLNTDVMSEDKEKAGTIIVNSMRDLCEHSGVELSDIKTIYLSGHSLDDASFRNMHQIVDQKVSKVNSFNSLNRQLNLESEEYVKKTPEKFLAAVGMVFEETGRS